MTGSWDVLWDFDLIALDNQVDVSKNLKLSDYVESQLMLKIWFELDRADNDKEDPCGTFSTWSFSPLI